MAMDEYYGDPEGGDVPHQRPSSNRPKEPDDSETQSALIPKSLFPGKECDVGDVLRLRVVAVHEGELEIEAVGYADDDEEEEEEKDEEVEETPAEPSEMDEMMA